MNNDKAVEEIEPIWEQVVAIGQSAPPEVWAKSVRAGLNMRLDMLNNDQLQRVVGFVTDNFYETRCV